MRLLTVGNMYPPHHRGGYELVWSSAVAHLESRGHRVRVLTTDHTTPDTEMATSAPDVFRELRWYWRDDAWPRLSFRKRLAIERWNATVLERHLDDYAPDVVCWWAMGGMSLSMLERVRGHGLPEAFAICDDWLLYGPRVDGWLRGASRLPVGRRLLERFTQAPASLRRAREGPALFPSETLRRRALAAGWSFTAASVCHQGVPRGLFQPAPPRPWGWRLAYVGRIDPRKGIDLAVRALELLPVEASLRIVGSGDQAYLLDLQALARNLGLERRVAFERRPREQLGTVYADCDLLLFPVRWQEPWGLVPLEAMAVGTPVVATGRGGSGEYLRDRENCLIFDPEGGPQALAAAARELAGDPDLRNRLRAGGLETTQRFDEHDFDHAVENLVLRAGAEPGRPN